MALAEIRDSRLYREEFETFEGYCRGRWDMSIRHSQRLMLSAGVIESLQTRPIGRIPANEAQVRPLTQLETPEAQQEAWERGTKKPPGGGWGGGIMFSATSQKTSMSDSSNSLCVSSSLQIRNLFNGTFLNIFLAVLFSSPIISPWHSSPVSLGYCLKEHFSGMIPSWIGQKMIGSDEILS